MSAFPGSPKTQKSAIVRLDPFNPLASAIVFQYNPRHARAHEVNTKFRKT